MTNESARDEALRLLVMEEIYATDGYVAAMSLDSFVRLIALARQRPGWVWVPEKGTNAIFAAGMSYDSRFTRLLVEAMWMSMLAAAPKPEGK